VLLFPPLLSDVPGPSLLNRAPQSLRSSSAWCKSALKDKGKCTRLPDPRAWPTFYNACRPLSHRAGKKDHYLRGYRWSR